MNSRIEVLERRMLFAALPTLTIRKQTGNASENGPTIRSFIITRTGDDNSAPLTAKLLIGGKARNGVDYNWTRPYATIPAGADSVRVKIRPIDDTLIEGGEFVWMTLASDAAYQLGDATQRGMKITDNDPPTIAISAGSSDASEAGPVSQSFTITRTGDQHHDITVNLLLGGSALGGDYQMTAAGMSVGSDGNTAQLVMSAGQTAATVLITPIDDVQAESTETVTLSIQAAAFSAYRIGSPSAATINIADDDTPFKTNLTWTTRAASPVPRGEAETAVFDNKLYVFGGYTDFTATNSTRCDVYDPAANTWTRIADMPVGVTHGGTAVVGRDVYIAGGYTGGPGGSQTFATTQVQKYNVDTNTWSTITPLPAARGGGAMAAVDTNDLSHVLHFFAGSDSSRLDRSEHWAFDLDNPGLGWFARASIPTSRTHLGAVTINNKIYAVGGQKNQDAAESPQAALERYDPVSDTWTSLAALPFGRSHIASATTIVNNHIVTLGGETTYQTSINNVTAYDIASNTWQELTPLPFAKASGVGAFIDGNYYYTTGGVSSSTYRGTPM